MAAGADNDAVIAALKTKLDEHKTTLEYKCCGIRLCSQKVLSSESQQAVEAFDLKPSHYYIYHVDTVN